MLVWIFMLLDLYSFGVITLAHFGILAGATTLLLFAAGYLGIKGLFFFGEPLSMIDFAIAFYILLMIIFGIHTFIYYFIAAWFIYKFIFTFLGGL